MKPIVSLSVVLFGLLLGAVGCHSPQSARDRAQTANQASDWQSLFDGHSLKGWRLYRQPQPPTAGWVVADGCLKKQAGVRGGDIITEATFGDFEFSWEWKVAPKGNNGVKYFVTEERPAAPGHEYQMIDDAGHPDARNGAKRLTASFYDVLPPVPDRPVKSAGEWNHSRIIVRGNFVEHWLNGARVLTYEIGSPLTKAGLQKSKFNDTPGFGDKIRGHIMLTDHQDECWFRDLKIREF